MNGNYRHCKNDGIYGKWTKHNIKKNYNTGVKKVKSHDCSEVDTDYEDCESESEDLDEIYCDTDEICDSHIENFLQENNIFIIELGTKQYLSKLINIQGKIFTFRFYRRNFDLVSDKFLKFTFPRVEDFLDLHIENDKEKILTCVKEFDYGRRGSILINSAIKSLFPNLN